ncbi:MAG: low molecular weight phosphotyrosine protein phosphatase [Nitrospinae bacterium]|nr:low molecular weight phosphotyrosine protein phosphatase [Nitrospinota bacterium]
MKKPEDSYQGKPIRKVLMVCLGNICRSPMAEYLLRDQLEKAGIYDITVSSAGLLDMEGREPAPDIVEILAEKGISIGHHKSRKLSGKLIMENDLILVMETKQRDEIAKALPAMAGKVWLLSQFGKVPEERDIPDPYGKKPFHYKACYSDIFFLVEGLFNFLLKNHMAFQGR